MSIQNLTTFDPFADGKCSFKPDKCLNKRGIIQFVYRANKFYFINFPIQKTYTRYNRINRVSIFLPLIWHTVDSKVNFHTRYRIIYDDSYNRHIDFITKLEIGIFIHMFPHCVRCVIYANIRNNKLSRLTHEFFSSSELSSIESDTKCIFTHFSLFINFSFSFISFSHSFVYSNKGCWWQRTRRSRTHSYSTT